MGNSLSRIEILLDKAPSAFSIFKRFCVHLSGKTILRRTLKVVLFRLIVGTILVCYTSTIVTIQEPPFPI